MKHFKQVGSVLLWAKIAIWTVAGAWLLFCGWFVYLMLKALIKYTGS